MPPKINAGKYRHRVTIKIPPGDSSRDGAGRRKKQPAATLAEIFAERQEWSESEVDELGRETPVMIVKWRTRYRADITPAMILEHDDQQFELLSVLDFDGTRRELVLESKRIDEV